MLNVAPARIPADWPNRQYSRILRCGHLDWHVQVAGSGPLVLLLHGSGASAHSWADVLPPLAQSVTVVAPDLPGHGYTLGAAPADLTLPRMAADLATLLAALGMAAPALVVGHSAGAALALRMALSTPLQPRALLGFNPSLVGPPEIYTRVLGPLISPIVTSSPVTALLAALANRSGMINRLLDSTGSNPGTQQRARYAALFDNPAHVRGALGFMAAADLPALLADACGLTLPCTFVLGANDAWVPVAPLRAVIAKHLSEARVETWAGGHLLHEIEPARAAALALSIVGAYPGAP
jgi:magnesium chelatase accessory protein